MRFVHLRTSNAERQAAKKTENQTRPYPSTTLIKASNGNAVEIMAARALHGDGTYGEGH